MIAILGDVEEASDCAEVINEASFACNDARSEEVHAITMKWDVLSVDFSCTASRPLSDGSLW